MKKKGVDGGFKILNFFFGFRPLQCLLVGWVGMCSLLGLYITF